METEGEGEAATKKGVYVVAEPERERSGPGSWNPVRRGDRRSDRRSDRQTPGSLDASSRTRRRRRKKARTEGKEKERQSSRGKGKDIHRPEESNESCVCGGGGYLRGDVDY